MAFYTLQQPIEAISVKDALALFESEETVSINSWLLVAVMTSQLVVKPNGKVALKIGDHSIELQMDTYLVRGVHNDSILYIPKDVFEKTYLQLPTEGAQA